MALDFGSLMSSIGAIGQGVSAIGLENQGAKLAVDGANYSAQAFQTAGTISIEGGDYTAETLQAAGDVAEQGAQYQKSVLQQAKTQALQGSQYQASIYTSSGAAAIAQSNYNQALDQVNTNRQLDVMGRQVNNLMSTNTASMGSSNLSTGSKSYLQVMSAAMSTFESNVVTIRGNSLNRQAAIRYQGAEAGEQATDNANASIYSGKIAAYNLDNQMVSAQYQADISKYSYNNQAVAARYQASVENYNDQVKAQEAVYQGQVASYQEGVQQAQQMGKLAGNIVSLF